MKCDGAEVETEVLYEQKILTQSTSASSLYLSTVHE